MEIFDRARRIPLFALVQYLKRLHPTARLRYLEDPSLTFHSSDVTDLAERWTPTGRIFDIRTPILGVIGASSPLASFFTEAVLADLGNDDSKVLAFHDILHHRLVELLVDAERRSLPSYVVRGDGEDAFTRRVRAGVGIRDDQPYGFSREAMLGLGRLLVTRPHTSDALKAALTLALPAHLIRFDHLVARDVPLEATQTAVLGRHATLGTSLIGGHVIGQTGLLRLSAGRVHGDELAALLPGGHLHRILAAVIEHSTTGLLDVELDVEVARGHEPSLRLGDERACLGAGALLGRAEDASPLHARIPISGDASVTYGPLEDASPRAR